MHYKPCKKSSELIEYLKHDKNVVYNKISPVEAQSILEHYNYINIITPYKHYFAKPKNPNDIYDSERDESGHHIYPKQTDFSEYYVCFLSEKEQYFEFYRAIMQFELMFKSQITYFFMKVYSVVTADDAKLGFNLMKEKVDRIKFKSSGTKSDIDHRKNVMKSQFEKFAQNLYDSKKKNGFIKPATDIYILFDRMNLSELLTVYYCFKPIHRKKIFEVMKNEGLNLGATTHTEFPSVIFNLVAIRNCIMHFNSLEILMKYSDYKNKKLRNAKSRESYDDILKALVYINKRYSKSI